MDPQCLTFPGHRNSYLRTLLCKKKKIAIRSRGPRPPVELGSDNFCYFLAKISQFFCFLNIFMTSGGGGLPSESSTVFIDPEAPQD